MNSKLLLVFVSVIFVFIGYGYLRAVPSGSNVDSYSGPMVLIEPKTFDFGEVEFGKVVEHAFKVKNAGSKILKISRVSTSCGCTKATVGKEKLEQGEETELLVTYDSGAMGKGVIGEKIERFVYIKSNDPKSPQVEVTIYARIK